MDHLFHRHEDFAIPHLTSNVETWDVSNFVNMTSLFEGQTEFNQVTLLKVYVKVRQP